MRNLLVGFLVGTLTVGSAIYCLQSAIASSAEVEVLLENNRVRVRQVRFEPGIHYGNHTHPYAHVGVILDEGTLEFIESGKSEKKEFKAGQVGWRDANVTHEVVNAGKNPMRVIEVELK